MLNENPVSTGNPTVDARLNERRRLFNERERLIQEVQARADERYASLKKSYDLCNEVAELYAARIKVLDRRITERDATIQALKAR